jgi:hypothetical protein
MPRKLKKFTAAQFAAHIRELSLYDAKFDNKFRPFMWSGTGTKFRVDLENGQAFIVTVKRTKADSI